MCSCVSSAPFRGSARSPPAPFAPDLDTFDSGRNFAAWLGLVPRQRSTGGKSKLGSVSKMGRTDIRRLLINGAMEGHAQRPDTRPIEDLAERPKITLAKQGASTHALSGPTAQTWVDGVVAALPIYPDLKAALRQGRSPGC
jgi:hypothetical protein